MNRPDAWMAPFTAPPAPSSSKPASACATPTDGFKLPACYVIHTVGPVYAKTKDKSHLLANCYRNALALPCLDRENKAALLFDA